MPKWRRDFRIFLQILLVIHVLLRICQAEEFQIPVGLFQTQNRQNRLRVQETGNVFVKNLCCRQYQKKFKNVFGIRQTCRWEERIFRCFHIPYPGQNHAQIQGSPVL